MMTRIEAQDYLGILVDAGYTSWQPRLPLDDYLDQTLIRIAEAFKTARADGISVTRQLIESLERAPVHES